MHWKPAGNYVVGAGADLAEIEQASDIAPELHKWKRYWLDEETYAKVKSSFGKSPRPKPGKRSTLTRIVALAKYTAGPDLTNFYMARSIHTVNHLISRTCGIHSLKRVQC